MHPSLTWQESNAVYGKNCINKLNNSWLFLKHHVLAGHEDVLWFTSVSLSQGYWDSGSLKMGTSHKKKQLLFITVMSHEHLGISKSCQLDCLFNGLFRATTRKISKLITGSLLRESTSDWWIPLTKGQWIGSVYMSWHHNLPWKWMNGQKYRCTDIGDKQRVLMHRHQGWNVRHGLCHIYMRYLYIYELFIAFVCFVVCSLL